MSESQTQDRLIDIDDIFDGADELVELLDNASPQDKAQSELELASEPLFVTLLRRSVQRLWPGDPVLQDFVDHVAGPLSAHLGHVTAKGGDFVVDKAAAGVDVTRFQADQSMRAHLINGLFPALHVARILQQWGAPQFRYYDDTVRRILIAGYVLHDWVKLPVVKEELERVGLAHDTINPAQHLPLVEAILRRCCTQLGLDRFLEPVGGLESSLHDLIFVVSNTQRKWGTLRNLSALPKLRLLGSQLDLAEQLSRLADYITYVGRSPRDAVSHEGLRREINVLSNQTAQLVYHHIADVRGVITNLVQNAALDAYSNNNCIPLLYAPSGVVYLARKADRSTPDVMTVAEQVVVRVKQVAGRILRTNLTGFGRDGKGLKHAPYYHLFFSPLDLLKVATDATAKIIHENKAPSAGKRFEKLATWMDLDIDLETVADVRVDQLAEWCYLAEKTVRELPGGGEAPRILIQTMGLEHLYTDFLAVPRDTRAGGVGYHWYFIAGYYLHHNRGLDPQAWRGRIETLAQTLRTYLLQQQEATFAQAPAGSDEATAAAADDGFADLRLYVQQVLNFGPTINPAHASTPIENPFAIELERYSGAKRRGRGSTAMCSLCSSPYTVDKQREAAILFAPQVYSNKLTLHGSNAIRDICAICSLEMMLRQLVMNQTAASGGRFEGRKLRYLYFYPAYFFTPETLALFRELYDQLRNLSFTELRRQLVREENGVPQVNFDPATWQRLEPLLLDTQLATEVSRDRHLRMHFPANEPITFFFLGVPPPGRDSKDAEAWVHPAFLALLLPLCVDVKVVASEASLPLLNEANELPETVYLDGAHAAIGYLVGKERLNLDQVWPMLNRLATSYLIHLDGNSAAGAGGFDYRWQDLPALARHLSESTLYAFHYLKKWQRKSNLDSLASAKAELYLLYQQYLTMGETNEMTHAQTLTNLYRKFYRTRGGKSHAIVRPLSIVAEGLLDADARLFDSQEALTEAVHGRLYVRIRQLFRENLAFPPARSTLEEQDLAMAEFARYFVGEVFFNAFRADLAALRGKQLNLLKNACEVLYRTAEAEYWRQRRAAGETIQAEEQLALEE